METNQVKAFLISQRDALVARREMLDAQLEANRRREREVKRGLADCDAAMRLFGLSP